MILCIESHALAFVSVPKVACTSIKMALQPLDGDRNGNVHDWGNWESILSPRELTRRRDLFRFAFVRNPLDRLLSCYADKLRLDSPDNGGILRQYGRRFQAGMRFDDFVYEVSRIPDRLANNHFASQHTIICPRGVLAVDFIGRFENLREDWGYVARRFGLSPLGVFKKSQHSDWIDAYDAELARLAVGRYRRDIELFGYAGQIHAAMPGAFDVDRHGSPSTHGVASIASLVWDML